jgi:serine/threonine protein phosphatase PrpC
MAVADGITSGEDGAAAAQCAVEMAANALGAGVATEASVIAAFAAARAAVNPWYVNSGSGGTTLCVMVADARRAVVGWVGDSAAFALNQGRWVRLTPHRSGSALTDWIGDGTVAAPHLRSFPLSGPAVLALATDGVELDDVQWDGRDPRGFVGWALTQCRVPSGDDATIVVASGR